MAAQKQALAELQHSLAAQSSTTDELSAYLTQAAEVNEGLQDENAQLQARSEESALRMRANFSSLLERAEQQHLELQCQAERAQVLEIRARFAMVSLSACALLL